MTCVREAGKAVTRDQIRLFRDKLFSWTVNREGLEDGGLIKHDKFQPGYP